MKNVILKPNQALIKPEEIPVKEALRLGLALPSRKVGKTILPPTPAGMGIFGKFAVELKDPSGKVVPFRSPVTGRSVKKLERPVHSFVRNFDFFIKGFLEHLDSALNQNVTLTDSSGAPYQPRIKGNGSTGWPSSMSLVSGLSRIKFGNSNAALDNTQTNLIGTLLGITTFGVVIVTLIGEDTVQTVFTVTGQVTNTSGGAFTVEEMGIFGLFADVAGNPNRETLMLRDLTGTVPVANGQTIIGTYTFTIAV